MQSYVGDDFQKRSDGRGLRVAKAIAIFVLAGLILAGNYWMRWVESGVQQPIEFPHKTHVQLNLPCSTCHQRVERDAVAGRPPTALCLACHSGGETDSPEIKKLRAFAAKEQEIPWKRVWRLPSDVYFPHRVHIVAAKIACQVCHGPMETLDRPPERALRKVTMDDCTACHEKRMRAENNEGEAMYPVKIAAPRTLNDCLTCHR